jgi:hypothetical protein
VKAVSLASMLGACITALGVALPAGAEPPARPLEHAVVDAAVVRFYAPETGGSSRPRFVGERMLAFEARLEALAEQASTPAEPYQERHVRVAFEHHIAEELLASLAIQGGTDPPDLPHMATDAKAALTQRVGGEVALRTAAAAEGIDGGEVDTMLRRQARAAYYIDRNVAPLLHPSDEQLREVFRTSAHPFKSRKYEDARLDLERWFVAERLRVTEASFLQTARSRVKVVILGG